MALPAYFRRGADVSVTDVLLKTISVHKRFGGIAATRNVSLEILAGEVHALIGPNGAGKTTLIAQLSGLLTPDSGQITFDSHDITDLPIYDRVKLGLARSYQITSIFKSFSVLDNIALAVQARTNTSYSVWKPIASDSALFDEAFALTEEIGLGARSDSIAGQLSHGEQRQLEVGLALATKPKLLLLDEPMAGMGPEESERLVGLLDKVRQQVTVLLVEHDMDAVFRLANRVSVLVNGELIVTDLPDVVRNSDEVKRAYLGDEVAS